MRYAAFLLTRFFLGGNQLPIADLTFYGRYICCLSFQRRTDATAASNSLLTAFRSDSLP